MEKKEDLTTSQHEDEELVPCSCFTTEGKRLPFECWIWVKKRPITADKRIVAILSDMTVEEANEALDRARDEIKRHSLKQDQIDSLCGGRLVCEYNTPIMTLNLDLEVKGSQPTRKVLKELGKLSRDFYLKFAKDFILEEERG